VSEKKKKDKKIDDFDLEEEEAITVENLSCIIKYTKYRELRTLFFEYLDNCKSSTVCFEAAMDQCVYTSKINEEEALKSFKREFSAAFNKKISIVKLDRTDFRKLVEKFIQLKKTRELLESLLFKFKEGKKRGVKEKNL